MKRAAACALIAVFLSSACFPPARVEDRPAVAVPDGASVLLDVRFIGVRVGGGDLLCAIYDDPRRFEAGVDPVATERLDGRHGTTVWTLELPEGEYAIKVFQDLNANGTLDRGAFGKPVEPYGFSNDARGTFGPPGWAEARFSLRSRRQSTEIRLR